MENHRIYAMAFAKVYPLYLAKVERKGRAAKDVDTVIAWLTGYDKPGIDKAIADQVDFQTFFANAPALNPAREQIKGVICGVRVEDIQEPLMREIRYLDKLVDEVAKGKAMEKILRAA